MGLLMFLLVIFSIVCFLLGYAYLNDKAEDLLMWSFTDKLEKVTDKDGYKKQQGKYTIVMGIIFFLVPVSIFAIEELDSNPKLLYIWIVVFVVVAATNAIQTRKYF
ncbi:DUF3784 domain-containing protein [Terribacillus halophilus]|jgi:UDP-N-acetylmuramyl pentapeptide phosphotransferase/UDP-N-acetylglucosamine-1-phosphate transferase|uniref:DUF3784 domain-containing protein n=1 Tax=Terribacillus halophilus TaxID=361279 RepID=UPI000984B0A2|nr:DUF3784 domain-containing protein [Terribacillus halophilus]